MTDIGQNRWKWATVVLCLICLVGPSAVRAQSQLDISDLFTRAIQGERTGLARKTKPVDARPARPGEKVVTFIAGEGKETQSPPAESGDVVVRNRCRATGNEEFLVKAAKFSERYEGPLGPRMTTVGQPTAHAATKCSISLFNQATALSHSRPRGVSL